MSIDGILPSIASVVAQSVAIDNTAEIVRFSKPERRSSSGVIVSLSAEGLALSRAAQASEKSNYNGNFSGSGHQHAKTEKAEATDRSANTAAESELKSKLTELSKVQTDPKLTEQQKHHLVMMISNEISALEQNLILDTKRESTRFNTMAINEPNMPQGRPEKNKLVELNTLGKREASVNLQRKRTNQQLYEQIQQL